MPSGVLTYSEARIYGIKAGAWGFLAGLLVGIIVLGIVYDVRHKNESRRVEHLLACDPATGEQSLLTRGADGQLRCEKRHLSLPTVVVN